MELIPGHTLSWYSPIEAFYELSIPLLPSGRLLRSTFRWTQNAYRFPTDFHWFRSKQQRSVREYFSTLLPIFRAYIIWSEKSHRYEWLYIYPPNAQPTLRLLRTRIGSIASLFVNISALLWSNMHVFTFRVFYLPLSTLWSASFFASDSDPTYDHFCFRGDIFFEYSVCSDNSFILHICALKCLFISPIDRTYELNYGVMFLSLVAVTFRIEMVVGKLYADRLLESIHMSLPWGYEIFQLTRCSSRSCRDHHCMGWAARHSWMFCIRNL